MGPATQKQCEKCLAKKENGNEKTGWQRLNPLAIVLGSVRS
jgi:hypothetical protein